MPRERTLKEFEFKNKDKIFSDLENAEPKAQTSYSAAEIVKMSRSIITLSIRKKNFTFADIAQYFNDHGCEITALDLEKEYKKLNKKSKALTSEKNDNLLVSKKLEDESNIK